MTGIRNRTLLLGLGNTIMSDDGAGVKVVQEISTRCAFGEDLQIVDGGTLGLDLLPLLEGVEVLLIVDAVDTGSLPGTIVRMEGDEIPVALETKLSPHQMGLKDLLATARLLGNEPDTMVLIGVQPGSIDMSVDLTPEVAAVMPELVEKVLFELESFGHNQLGS